MITNKGKGEDRKARQFWATPWWVVRGVEELSGYRITLDVCAELSTAKAPVWFGPMSMNGADGLTAGWARFVGSGDAAWCNPPYNDLMSWVRRAITMAGFGLRTFMLIPYRSDRPYVASLLDYHSAHLTNLWGDKVKDGRIAFEPPPGVEASTPMGGVVLWQVGGSRRLPLTLRTSELKAAGERRIKAINEKQKGVLA